MEKYREILERMQGAYREKSGWEPEAVSDLGLRLQVLAGELCRLHARLDWLQAQAFPQTAVGKQLGLHGGQRGIVRRGGERALALTSSSPKGPSAPPMEKRRWSTRPLRTGFWLPAR